MNGIALLVIRQESLACLQEFGMDYSDGVLTNYALERKLV
jgi:hypothetical protein